MIFPYSPAGVAKIKTVPGRRWHADEKCWTVPHTDGAIAHLLVLFAGEPVDIDPSLRSTGIPANGEPPPNPGTPHAMVPVSAIPGRMRQALRARHYSRSTEEAYVGWVRRFIDFHGQRHPAEMGEPDVNRFLTHLAVHDRVAASTQNQALAALLFLLRVNNLQVQQPQRA